MKLSDKWFVAFMENEAGNMIIVKGRDELNEFKTCGKLKENKNLLLFKIAIY